MDHLKADEDAIFLLEVRLEIIKARNKFPSADACLAALTEEVGELAQAMLSKDQAEIYGEAVQVAAMALRCAVEGDISLRSYRKRHGFDFSRREK